ncbi:MAG TPA: TonB family protein [Candidatus Saccharimonadales bacterium]|nr:TonB family protein [Candidatus Saccharimonadales bacterium]
MTDSWTQLEGHLVDEKFPLRRYLGGSDHSIVFLTHRPDDSVQDAAIKLIPADSIVPDLQFSRWRLAAQLSHPHLLRQFATGRCQLDGRDWLYIVTEHAEENLAQILPERPLTPEELGDAMEPLLDALVYLHSRNFVHARIKPPNILVAGDQVKLSTDGVLQLDDSSGRPQFPSAYDAPEYASGSISAASDSWSLGMAVVEALTQKLPEASAEQDARPRVPSTLPASFLDIARHTLQPDPEKRWTVTEIATRLNPQSRAAAAAASAKAVAPPAMSQPVHTAYVSRLAQTQSWQLPPGPAAKKYPSAKPSYFWLSTIAVLVLVASLAIPKFANHDANNSASTSAAPAVANRQPAAPARSARAQSAVPRPRPKSPERTPPAAAQQPSRSPDSLKTASEREKIPAPSAASPAAGSPTRGAKGAVLGQVLPEVSEKARATIRGTVRVNVRVQVSPAGKVTQAERDSGSSSPYFTDLSLEAARRWAFRPAELAGHGAPTEWLIRFEFSPSDTKAFPEQANP